MANILADMTVPDPVVNGLRRRGHDVVTTLEAGCALLTIDRLLHRAARERRALLTLDRDVLIAHDGWAATVGPASSPDSPRPPHSGVILMQVELAERFQEEMIAFLDGNPELPGWLYRWRPGHWYLRYPDQTWGMAS